MENYRGSGSRYREKSANNYWTISGNEEWSGFYIKRRRKIGDIDLFEYAFSLFAYSTKEGEVDSDGEYDKD